MGLSSGPPEAKAFDSAALRRLTTAMRSRRAALVGAERREAACTDLEELRAFAEQASDPVVAARALCLAAEGVQAELHDFRTAADLFEEALELNPFLERAAQQVEVLLHKQGAQQRRIDLLRRRAEVLDSSKSASDAVRGAAFRQAALVQRDFGQDPLDALPLYERAVALDPEVDSLEALSNLYVQRGEPGDEEQAADILASIAEVLKGDEAIDYACRALDLMPDHNEAMTLLERLVPPKEHGRVLRKRLVDYIARAGDDDDGDPRRVHLARVFESEGKLKEGIACLAPAAERGHRQAAQLREELLAQKRRTVPRERSVSTTLVGLPGHFATQAGHQPPPEDAAHAAQKAGACGGDQEPSASAETEAPDPNSGGLQAKSGRPLVQKPAVLADAAAADALPESSEDAPETAAERTEAADAASTAASIQAGPAQTAKVAVEPAAPLAGVQVPARVAAPPQAPALARSAAELSAAAPTAAETSEGQTSRSPGPTPAPGTDASGGGLAPEREQAQTAEPAGDNPRGVMRHADPRPEPTPPIPAAAMTGGAPASEALLAPTSDLSASERADIAVVSTAVPGRTAEPQRLPEASVPLPPPPPVVVAPRAAAVPPKPSPVSASVAEVDPDPGSVAPSSDLRATRGLSFPSLSFPVQPVWPYRIALVAALFVAAAAVVFVAFDPEQTSTLPAVFQTSAGHLRSATGSASGAAAEARGGRPTTDKAAQPGVSFQHRSTQFTGAAIDRTAFYTALAGQKAPLLRCYKRALLRRPQLSGYLVFSFLLTEPRPRRVSAAPRGTFRDSRLARCVVDVLENAELPIAPGGSARVELPVYFNP